MKKPKSKKRASSYKFYLILFMLLAFIIVMALEYLDQSQGRPAFVLDFFAGKTTKKKQEPSDFHKHLIALLKNTQTKFSVIRDSGHIPHVKISIKKKSLNLTESRIRKLSRKFKFNFKKEESEKKDGSRILLFSISKNSWISHYILITTEAETAQSDPVPASKTDHRPKVAFIIDDIGYRELGALELKKLGIPVTGAIIPHAPYAYDEARQLQKYGLEQIIHLPMESRNPKMENHREKFVNREDSLNDIRQLLRNSRQIVPFARGVNNHMGSLITADTKTMKKVLRVLTEEKLFFVDSRTCVDTVAYDIARRMHVKTVKRDVFLEDINGGQITVKYTVNQIHRLAEKALKNGKALAIGHPYPSTLRAIRESAGRLKARGIRIVFVSEMLE